MRNIYEKGYFDALDSVEEIVNNLSIDDIDENSRDLVLATVRTHREETLTLITTLVRKGFGK